MNTIVFFVGTISNGGAEAVCVNIANGLAERGWQVDLLVLHTKDKSYIDRLSSKVNLIDLKAGRARYAAPALLWYILKHKPKQLVIFKYDLIDLVVIIKKLFKLRLTLIGRNMTIFSESIKRRNYVRTKLKTLLVGKHPMEFLDRVINQSFEMQKDLLDVFPSLKEKSIVIHNPVASHIEQYANENHLGLGKEQRNYILCVGRLVEVKAFHHAINAFSIIAKKHPTLRLKFLGQGPMEEKLKELVADLDLNSRVDFEGFQTNIIPYYRNAALTLLTSNYEGFPNVLIESIVLGTPVVSFDCPSGPREILDYGKYGKLVTLGDVEGLVGAIEDVLSNPHQFDLVERSKFFSLNKAIDKYESLLKGE